MSTQLTSTDDLVGQKSSDWSDSRWSIKSTRTLGKFHKALALAQAEIANPPKSQEARAGTFNFNYASLSDALDSVRKVLSKHGIAFYQSPVQTLRGNYLVSRLACEDEGIEVEYPISATGHKMTDVGAQVTFLRRYQLFPLVGIAGEDDVDGDDLNEAVTKASSAKATAANEEAVIRSIRADFSSAQNVAELIRLKDRHLPVITALSSVAQAALRRAYSEAENRLNGSSA